MVTFHDPKDTLQRRLEQRDKALGIVRKFKPRPIPRSSVGDLYRVVNPWWPTGVDGKLLKVVAETAGSKGKEFTMHFVELNWLFPNGVVFGYLDLLRYLKLENGPW